MQAEAVGEEKLSWPTVAGMEGIAKLELAAVLPLKSVKQQKKPRGYMVLGVDLLGSPPILAQLFSFLMNVGIYKVLQKGFKEFQDYRHHKFPQL